MDHILVRDLAARAIIGDNPGERRLRQDLVLQLRLGYDGGKAARTDKLTDALDYRALKKRVLALVEASEFHLIEALAEAVAKSCFEDALVQEVTVTIDKPGALRFARSVAVEITRGRRARPTRRRLA